jgi:hypothetical protein
MRIFFVLALATSVTVSTTYGFAIFYASSFSKALFHALETPVFGGRQRRATDVVFTDGMDHALQQQMYEYLGEQMGDNGTGTTSGAEDDAFGPSPVGRPMGANVTGTPVASPAFQPSATVAIPNAFSVATAAADHLFRSETGLIITYLFFALIGACLVLLGASCIRPRTQLCGRRNRRPVTHTYTLWCCPSVPAETPPSRQCPGMNGTATMVETAGDWVAMASLAGVTVENAYVYETPDVAAPVTESPTTTSAQDPPVSAADTARVSDTPAAEPGQLVGPPVPFPMNLPDVVQE